MLKIGELVDQKYRVLSEIGHGGMSVVYMAINERANKTWAIKEVRKDGVKDFETIKQGLVVETEMLKRLKHPNLPSIIDVIEKNDTLLIVMDYIEGHPLSKAIEEYGAQPQNLVIDWAKQLCDVLGYLHTRKPAIIYRDMKPANIMLKPDGTLTLIDFGTAREFKERNLADTTCLGTIGYAAPEQFGGMGQTDARTDIYCLGATMYHLVTGCSPCEPPYDIRPIREINPALSSGLERIIAKCTQRNPNDRYQSCAELMYALEHYEEIDDLFRKRQKKKLTTVAAMLMCAIIFGTAGIALGSYARSKASGTYRIKMEEAEKTSDYNSKVSCYLEAIKISKMSGEKDAYLGLIDLFKSNDYQFTRQEEETLVKYLKNYKNELLKDPDAYALISFETGKLYWYYYVYGEGDQNQVTRMKAAETWFSDTVTYSNEDFKYRNMAIIYRDIGKFYRDISINTVEASDKGMYVPFFDNLSSLLTLVEENDNESEIVKLELYELVRSAIHQYATKLKGDGVTKEEMISLLDRVANHIEDMDVTTDVTKQMREDTSHLMEDTRAAVGRAFDNRP